MESQRSTISCITQLTYFLGLVCAYTTDLGHIHPSALCCFERSVHVCLKLFGQYQVERWSYGQLAVNVMLLDELLYPNDELEIPYIGSLFECYGF